MKLIPKGKGAFSNIFLGEDGMIYAFTKASHDIANTDMSKEIVSIICHNHDCLPKIECLGLFTLPRYGQRLVYKMPHYYRLTGQSLKIAKLMEKLFDNFDPNFDLIVCGKSWYNRSMLLVDSLQDKLPEHITDAIYGVVSIALTYGNAYTLDLALRNIKQDGNGNIILLDIIFNVKAQDDW